MKISPPSLGNENSAQSFSDRSFWKSLRVVDVRAFGSRPNACFARILSALTEPGYPREWPPEVRGISVPKTSSLGWFFGLDSLSWRKGPPAPQKNTYNKKQDQKTEATPQTSPPQPLEGCLPQTQQNRRNARPQLLNWAGGVPGHNNKSTPQTRATSRKRTTKTCSMNHTTKRRKSYPRTEILTTSSKETTSTEIRTFLTVKGPLNYKNDKNNEKLRKY